MTSSKKIRAILEDREDTAEEEGRLREEAQAEMALKWKRLRESKRKGEAA